MLIVDGRYGGNHGTQLGSRASRSQIGLDLALVVIKLGEEFPLQAGQSPDCQVLRRSRGRGCLSVPGVWRVTLSQVSPFQDRAGRKRSWRRQATWRALQHELDTCRGYSLSTRSPSTSTKESKHAHLYGNCRFACYCGWIGRGRTTPGSSSPAPRPCRSIRPSPPPVNGLVGN